MRKNLNKIVALSMSLFMVGTMMPTMSVKADNTATTVKTVNSEFINGDFEKGLDAWTILNGSAEVIEEGTGHVLKVTGSAKVQATAWVVKPSTEYMISYDAKIENTGSVSINKHEWDWDGASSYKSVDTAYVENAAVYNTVGSWGKKTYKFTTSASTTMVQIHFAIEGNVKIDNVTITKAEGITEHAATGAEAWKDTEGNQLNECETKVPTEEKIYETIDNIGKFDMSDTNVFSVDVSKDQANEAKCYVDSENGNNYMHYELGNLAQYTGHSYTIEAGKEYIVSFKYRIKEKNGHNIALAFQENDDWSMNKITSDYLSSDSEGWNDVKTTYVPKSNQKKVIDIFVLCYGNTSNLASFDIDDFYVAETVNKKKIDTAYENNMEESGLSTQPHVSDPDAVITYKENDDNKYMNYSCTNTCQYTGKTLNVVAGETYTLSYKIRVNTIPSSVSIGMGLQENSGWTIPVVGGYKTTTTDGWVSVEGNYTVPENVTTLDLFVLNYGNNTDLSDFDIDDIKITKKSNEDEDPVISKSGYGKNIGANGTDGVALMSNSSAYITLNNVKKDSTYEYGFWYKIVDADEDASFETVVSYDEKGDFLEEEYAKNAGWTYASGSFTATDDNTKLGFSYTGDGMVLVSGVTVEDCVDIHIHHGKVTAYGATCTEDSKKVYTCDDCGNVVYSEYTGDYTGEGCEKAKGHDFSVKVKTVDSTYETKGYTVYRCSHEGCNETEHRDFTAVKVKPTTTTTTTTTTKLKAPGQVKSVKITAKKKSLKVTWKKISGVKKYQVQICTNKKFKKGVIKKNASKNSLTVKKLKAKKKYYVRVRAIKTSGKQTAYGKWSKVANKKTK